MKPWELQWHKFEMPDGLTASYAFDGKEVSLMLDEEQIPEDIDYQERLNQCYDHFFTNIYPTL